ncbi:hypothetical protein EDC32_1011275 [Laceyella sacchari]|nr:hypothetical protein EDC32_1011275 [Laceyella sacchari]
MRKEVIVVKRFAKDDDRIIMEIDMDDWTSPQGQPKPKK